MSQHPLGFINISTNELCFTETCIQAASGLLSSLNMNVDPCSDFYEYACGNWIKQTIIPEDLTEFGILDVSAYQHKERLRTIFDGTYEDLLSSTRSLKTYQVDTKENKRVDKKNFKLIKDYFSSCTETQSELDVFLGDLKSLQRLDSHRDFELTEDLFRIVSEPEYSTDSLVINVGGLFTLEMNTMNKVLMLSPPKSFKDVEYETKIDLVMSVLGTRNFTNRDQRRIATMRTIDLVPLSNSEIYTMVDSTVSLQERLIELAESDPDAYYTYKLSKVKELFPFINWEGMPLSDVPIQVYSQDYFKELNYYANIQDPTRPIHKQAITHFLLLNKILTEAPKLDSELRQIVPDSIFQTRASLCLEKCLERFGLAAGRFYAMIAFGGESDKLRLEKIAQHIKIALNDRIQNADWLDDSTKSSALKKLRMMQTSIGYSTFSPDQRSPKDIYQFMFGLKTDYNTFYENDRALSLWRIKTYWDTLNKTLDSTAWIGVTSPQVVNAFNLLSQNSIFVSAGFAQKPNYDSHYPDYFNYAGIGQSIGHEYSHGFDDLGSQYDEFGLERNWWSKDTKKKYEHKTQCFVDSYSKASVKDKKGKSYFLDGTLTLGESIADHEGLTAAYYAYLDSKSDPEAYNPTLPGLQQFSKESLFFINAARSFCSKSMAEADKDSLFDEHAPDSIRLNMLLRNSMEFSKVFNCPMGSKMNPSKLKCQIW